MTEHWMENAEYVTDGTGLGQCDNGDLWVWKPNRTVKDARSHWLGRWVQFDARNPRHWLAYWRARRARRIVMLEASRG